HGEEPRLPMPISRRLAVVQDQTRCGHLIDRADDVVVGELGQGVKFSVRVQIPVFISGIGHPTILALFVIALERISRDHATAERQTLIALTIKGLRERIMLSPQIRLEDAITLSLLYIVVC